MPLPPAPCQLLAVGRRAGCAGRDSFRDTWAYVDLGGSVCVSEFRNSPQPAKYDGNLIPEPRIRGSIIHRGPTLIFVDLDLILGCILNVSWAQRLGFSNCYGFVFTSFFFVPSFLNRNLDSWGFSKHGFCMENIVKHSVSQKSFSIQLGAFLFSFLFGRLWGIFLIFIALQPFLKIDTFSGWLQIQNSPVPKRNHRQIWACKHFYSSWPTAESRTDDC